VTHDQDEALTMSDRVAVMNGGRINQLGTPQELYEAPDTAFVANFLGAANLVPVTARRDGDGVHCELGNFSLRSDDAGAVAGESVAMIRPEYVKLEPQGTTGENRVPGMVEEVVYLGFHQDVRVRLANGSLVRADVPNDGSAPEYDQGDAVSVHLQARHLRLLESDPDVAPGPAAALADLSELTELA
jgi:ABC-type Fe3+/spermidine/putrescine transport system ATPase subunit